MDSFYKKSIKVRKVKTKNNTIQQVQSNILSTNEKISYIYHISDLHIRPTERIEEYREIFNKFVNIPKEQNSVIVITGDIFDKKNVLTPESILLLREFLGELSKDNAVFIILGNHDTILQKNCLDSLSASLHLLPNVYYLRDSGEYEYGNVVFVVNSLLDTKITKITNKKDDKVYVSLYHGTLYGSKLFNETTLETTTIKKEDFGDYDLLLLGDIHKHQFMGERCAYAGSLIQQNFGETQDGHGYIKWNLGVLKGEFNEVINTYGFITLTMKGKFKKPKNMKHLKNLYLRVYYPDNNKEKYEEDMINFRSKYNILYEREEFSMIDTKPLVKCIETNKDNIVLEYLDKLEISEKTREELLKLDKSLCVKELNLSEKKTWRINSIEFRNIFIYGNDNINKIDFVKNRGFMKVFGGNAIGKSTISNIITFGLFGTEVNGLNLCDIPYNRSNNNYIKMQFQISNTVYELERQIRITKKKDGSLKGEYSKCNLYKIMSNDFRDILTHSNMETTKKIKELIGTYDEFELTSLISQKHIGLLQYTPKERMRIMGSLLRLDIYKEIEKVVKEKVKENNKQINTLNGNLEMLENYTEEKLLKLEEEINELKDIKYDYYELPLESEVKKIMDNLSILSQITDIDVSELPKLKIRYNKLLKEVQKINISDTTDPEPLLNKLMIDKDNLEIKEIKNYVSYDDIMNINEKLNYLYTTRVKLNKINSPEEELNKIKNELLNYDNVYIEKKIKEIKRNIIQIDDNLCDLTETKKEVLNYLDNYKNRQVIIPEYIRSNIRYIFETPNINKTEIMNRNKILEKELIVFEEKSNKYLELTDRLLILENQNNLYKQYLLDKKKNEIINEEIEMLIDVKKQLEEDYKIQKDNEINELKLKILNEKIEELNKKLIDYKLLEKNKKKVNELLDLQKIVLELSKKENLDKKALEEYINDYNYKKLKNHELDITRVKNDTKLSTLEEQLIEYTKNYNKKKEIIISLEKLKEMDEIYKIYLGMNNALPQLMIQSQIPLLEITVNDILKDLVDFTIKIEMIDNEIVFSHIKADNTRISINACSGYESFVLNMALKLSLKHFGFIPYPSFISIDEGWDCISQENYDKLSIIFDKLYNSYYNILIISHLPKIQSKLDNYVGMLLNIKKQNGSSQI